MRFATKHLQFVLVAVGVAALVAIDLYAGNKDQNVPLAEQQQENGMNESVSPNLERRAVEGGDGGGDMLNELDMYNNNMLDASLAAHGEELPAAAYQPQMLGGQDDQAVRGQTRPLGQGGHFFRQTHARACYRLAKPV